MSGSTATAYIVREIDAYNLIQERPAFSEGNQEAVIQACCENLKEDERIFLDFHRVQISADLLLRLLNELPQESITSLSIGKLVGFSNTIETLARKIGSLANLWFLNMNQTTVSDQFFQSLVDGRTSLKEVQLYKLPHIKKAKKILEDANITVHIEKK